MERHDPIKARMHERSADRHRKAAERLRDADLTEAEEAAKRVARDEDTRAAKADSPKR
jgi:hypothetical protein